MNAPLDTAVHTDANNVALDAIDVSDPRLYQDDIWYPYFERLRREDPVHYCPESLYGPYWSVTKYKDIMQVEVNHQVYSSASELGGIAIEDQPKDMERPSFIRMDPPRHDEQRKVVSPVVAPANLANMEGADPRAHRPGARRPAAQRDLRLGRPGVDRADDDDARDLVRLSLGRPAPADLLVGCRDRQCQRSPEVAGALGRGEASPS